MKKLILSLIFISSNALAQKLPEYDAPELLVRAHQQSTYNLPALTYLHNTSPSLNNQGDVALKLMAVDGTTDQAIWFKKAADKAGQVIYTASDDNYLTDPTVNDQGLVTFSPFNEIISQGLYVYDSVQDHLQQLVSGKEHQILYFGYHKILQDGTAVFRATSPGFERSYVQYNNGHMKNIAVEGESHFEIPSSYLFGPAVNEKKSGLLRCA